MTAIDSPVWTSRFLDLADLVATWSRDPSTKVGAVVVNPRKRVVGLGYNGFPDKIADAPEWLSDRATKLSMVIHAEVNAILNKTSASVDDCTLFVSGPPCADCAKFVIQAGIVAVHHRDFPGDFSERWADSLRQAHLIFERGKVAITRHGRGDSLT